MSYYIRNMEVSESKIGPRVIISKTRTCRGCPALSKTKCEETEQSGSIIIWHEFHCNAKKIPRKMDPNSQLLTPWWCPSKLEFPLNQNNGESNG